MVPLALWIEASTAVDAFVFTFYVLTDTHFGSAGTAQNRSFFPLRYGPNLDGMTCQLRMAVFASIVMPAALHLDGNDVGGPVIVSTTRLWVQPNTSHLHRTTLGKRSDALFPYSPNVVQGIRRGTIRRGDPLL